MQYFNCSNHITTNADEYLRDLDSLLAGVHRVEHLQVMGGEPLLYGDLSLLLREIKARRKIRRFYIVTNCTIVPSPEMLYVFKKLGRRFAVILSDYTGNPELVDRVKFDEITARLIEYGVRIISRKGFYWHDMGGIDSRRYDRQELEELYKTCDNYCFSLFNGQLHVCPRSSMLISLGRPLEPEDFVSLRTGETPKNFRQRLMNFISTEHLSPCQFCNKKRSRNRVMVAEQMERSL
jgi:MoaA/NifB/PqqE/SkfB family radical SAM enzyme